MFDTLAFDTPEKPGSAGADKRLGVLDDASLARVGGGEQNSPGNLSVLTGLGHVLLTDSFAPMRYSDVWVPITTVS